MFAIALLLFDGGIVWRTNTLAGEAATPATRPADAGRVRKLVLPELEPDLPPAKGVETVKIMCGMCHTPHYILNQPPLPRDVWTAEVTKMQKVFSGPIPQEQVPDILDYLMAVRGTKSQ